MFSSEENARSGNDKGRQIVLLIKRINFEVFVDINH